MKIATVSSKGQITIPKNILENILKITYGNKVILTPSNNALIIKPLKHSIVNQTAGSLKKFVNPQLLNIPFTKVREETQKLAAAELKKNTNEVLLDSNVLLRHLLQDLPPQARIATELIEAIEKGNKVGHISILVINETIWVLKKFYKIERQNYIPQILKILQINNIKIIEIKKETLNKILEIMNKKEIDFTDIYLSEIAGNRKITSFDQNFEKLEK